MTVIICVAFFTALIAILLDSSLSYLFLFQKSKKTTEFRALLRPRSSDPAPTAKTDEPTIDELIAQKLIQWKALKEDGLLQKLATSSLDDDSLAEFDIKANKVLESKGLPRVQKIENGELDRSTANPRVLKELEAKIVSVSKNEVKLYNILLEIRDKGIAEECEDLVMQIFELLPKLAGTKLEAAVKLFIAWQEDCILEFEAEFWEGWIRKVAINHPPEKRKVLELLLLNAELVREEELWIAELLGDIRFHPQDTKVLSYKLQEFVTRLEEFSLEGINDVIKALGLAGYQRDCFAIIDRMRKSKNFQLRPDIVTLEFLVNSIILPVVKEETAKNMKELPVTNNSIPEIILLGRSNVGKSSLTNLLLNRKNLASVSATPGHTQAFHFFSLERRATLSKCLLSRNVTNIPGSKQPLRIVDIPGLGYAETVDEGRQQSWRSLIMRYLAVRDSCRMVLHLVDSRHPLSDVDKEIITMVNEAQQERATSNKQPFHFTTILTKADKLKSQVQIDKAVAAKRQEIERVLSNIPAEPNRSIMVTSATEKMGLEQLWLHILDGAYSDR